MVVLGYNGVGSRYGYFEVLGGGCKPQVYWTIEKCLLVIDCWTLRGPYAFLEHSSAELVVAARDGHPIRFKPERLGCYVIYVNRTERGLAKELLRDYWEV